MHQSAIGTMNDKTTDGSQIIQGDPIDFDIQECQPYIKPASLLTNDWTALLRFL
jgi:hypothetical protein